MTEKLLSLSIGGTSINAPGGIPTGGLDTSYSIGSSILTLAFIIVILLALAYLIWGGIRWVLSGGDKAKVDAARKTIIYAIMGLIFIFLSFLIINVITYIFNVPSLTSLPGTN